MELVYVKCDDDAVEPTRGTVGSAGWDLYTPKTVMVSDAIKHSREFTYNGTTEWENPIFKIRTGIKIALPSSKYYAQIATKSSFALRGIFVTGGVIDSDYRGEICVVMQAIGVYNKDSIFVSKGSKIAQLIVHHIEADLDWKLAADFDHVTDRGEGGFGSTGK